jgi:hypothetical protein
LYSAGIDFFGPALDEITILATHLLLSKPAIMRKILFALLSIAIILTSCNDYGKKVAIGKNEVFYKEDGVVEADAKKLGDYLKIAGYFNDSAAKSVQLTKQDNAYVLRLVVDKDKLDTNDQSMMNQYWLMQDLVSQNAFNGAKTKIILADTKLKDIQPVENLTKLIIGNFQIYLRGNDVTEAQAKKIVSLLKEQNYFGNAQEAVSLEKKNGVYALNFVYNQEYYKKNQEELLPIFKMIQWLTSEEAFNNSKTAVNLSDTYFVAYEPVGEFSQAEKERLVQQGQQKPE